MSETIINEKPKETKYLADGVPIWERRCDAPGHLWDSATDVAVDTSGYVIGSGASVDYNAADYVGASYYCYDHRIIG